MTEAELADKSGVHDASSHDDYDEREPRVLRSMRDNPDDYDIEPVGLVPEVHRFRTLPDFEFSSTFDPLYQDMRKHLLPLSVPALKGFTLHQQQHGGQPQPKSQLRPGASVGPPPSAVFQNPGAPHNWAYRQNPLIRWGHDPTTGAPVPVNIQAPDSHALLTCEREDQPVPTGPPSHLEPETKLDANARRLLGRLRGVFAQRPVVTRRVIFNLIPDEVENQIKALLQYVAFTFPHGPWRDALVRYGIDPRRDPKYRIYQTMTFKIPTQRREVATTTTTRDSQHPHPSTDGGPDPDAPGGGGGGGGGGSEWVESRTEWRRTRAHTTRDVTSHLFDGQRVVADGRIWQVCDVTDPLVAGVLATRRLRRAVEPTLDGWFCNGTWAKARVLIRDKIARLTAGRGPPDDAEYDYIVNALPDVIGPAEPVLRRPKDLSDHVLWLASQVRTLARHNYHVRKEPKAKGRVEEEEDDEDEDDEDAEGDMDEGDPEAGEDEDDEVDEDEDMADAAPEDEGPTQLEEDNDDDDY
jgi:general transcription factor 3C polypeptide 5 (transcription factor C subunit 1)